MTPNQQTSKASDAAPLGTLFSRRWTEAELNDQKMLLQTIVDAMPDVVSLQDTSHHILLMNKSGCQYLGTTAETAGEKRCYELLGASKPCAQCGCEEAVATGKVCIRERYLPDKNSWLEERSIPIFDLSGKVVRVLDILRDITKQKQTEETLQQVQALNEMALRFSSQLINLDLDKIDTYLQGALQEIALFEKADLAHIFRLSEGKNEFRPIFAWAAEGWENLSKVFGGPYRVSDWFFSRILQGETLIVDTVRDLPPPSQQKIAATSKDIQSFLLVPLEAEGTLFGMVGFLRTDKNHRWPREHLVVLKLFGKIIASALMRKTADENLRKAKQAAEEANKAKDSFLSMMSHELRTPLHAILGFSEMLEKSISDQPDKETPQMVKTIHQCGHVLLDLVEDILDLSQTSAGKINFIRCSFDPTALLREIIHVFEPKALAKHLDLEVQMEGLPRLVSGDPRRLRQIIFNVVGNAIKYTEQGSVLVRMDFQSGQLHLTVVDTGIGIPEEAKDHLFEPYFRGGSGKVKNIEGVGLGLSIVKNMLRQIGGEIHIESEIGKGTVATVDYPVFEEVF